jgi:predicted transcriptional regulator of viral defense system
MERYKTLKDSSAKLLADLNSRDQQFFTIEDAMDILSSSNHGAVLQLVRQMVKRGLLMRIKGGLYHIIPYDKDPDSYQPDWHLTAVSLVGEADYYIGYYSALSIHSLITQPALKEQIVVNKQPVKKIVRIKNTEFQFIYHNDNHFFGAKSTWIDNFNKIKCSDIEKTIIDCLFLPEYGGGIVETAKALYKANEKIDFERMYDYALRFDSQAVIKRLGYLMEILEIKHPVIEKFQKVRSSSFTLLDPSLPKEGKMLRRWNIQLNIDEETIKSALSH